jgi:hypothetical protein
MITQSNIQNPKSPGLARRSQTKAAAPPEGVQNRRHVKYLKYPSHDVRAYGKTRSMMQNEHPGREPDPFGPPSAPMVPDRKVLITGAAPITDHFASPCPSERTKLCHFCAKTVPKYFFSRARRRGYAKPNRFPTGKWECSAVPAVSDICLSYVRHVSDRLALGGTGWRI